MTNQKISATQCELRDIAAFRDSYRLEMSCQIIHDSVHDRAGWTKEYLLRVGSVAIGYGSVAVAGPWKSEPTLYEFFVVQPFRQQLFEAFQAVQSASGTRRVETQSNDRLLTNMLLAFAKEVSSESILFRDGFTTSLAQPGAVLRRAELGDASSIAAADLDPEATWVLEQEGHVVAAGDILYHYNRPYGDIYMKVAQEYRSRGLGAFLVQELKKICYASGNVPAARCNVQNVASRKTLQRAGFVPCGHILIGNLLVVPG